MRLEGLLPELAHIEDAETPKEACARANQPINRAFANYMRESLSERSPSHEQLMKTNRAWLHWYDLAHKSIPQKRDLVIFRGLRIPFVPRYL